MYVITIATARFCLLFEMRLVVQFVFDFAPLSLKVTPNFTK